MKRVVLIADLEGITGVDSVHALALGAPDYPAAAQRMTEEVTWVAQRLLAQGAGAVHVVDTHQSGAVLNVDAGQLPTGCELFAEDALSLDALLRDASALACVGMHAGGTSPGFGAHTVCAHTAWRLGELPLSETHLLALRAGELGLPVWFTSGDDVLAAQTATLITCVRTKQALSRGEALSRPREAVRRDFEAAFARPPGPPWRPAPAPLRLRFQREAEAALAARAGGRSVSRVEVEVPPGARFADQHAEALRLVEASNEAVLGRLQGVPGTSAFAHSAAQLLLSPWDER